MSSPNLPAHVTISPDVLYQNVDGLAVLLDLRDENYYSLDDVGTQIWKLVTEHQDVSRILEEMLALYQVDPNTLREDLAVFLTKLSNAGLLQSSPEFLTS